MRFVDDVLRTPGAYPGECESTLTVYTMGIRPADEPPGGRPHFPTALLQALARIPQQPVPRLPVAGPYLRSVDAALVF